MKKEKEIELMKKSKFKKSLEEQVNFIQTIKKSHLHDDDKYVKSIYDDVKKWEIEEKIKKESIQKKYHEELAIQKKQIVDKQLVIPLPIIDEFLNRYSYS